MKCTIFTPAEIFFVALTFFLLQKKYVYNVRFKQTYVLKNCFVSEKRGGQAERKREKEIKRERDRQ